MKVLTGDDGRDGLLSVKVELPQRVFLLSHYHCETRHTAQDDECER